MSRPHRSRFSTRLVLFLLSLSVAAAATAVPPGWHESEPLCKLECRSKGYELSVGHWPQPPPGHQEYFMEVVKRPMSQYMSATTYLFLQDHHIFPSWHVDHIDKVEEDATLADGFCDIAGIPITGTVYEVVTRNPNEFVNGGVEFPAEDDDPCRMGTAQRVAFYNRLVTTQHLDPRLLLPLCDDRCVEVELPEGKEPEGPWGAHGCLPAEYANWGEVPEAQIEEIKKWCDFPTAPAKAAAGLEHPADFQGPKAPPTPQARCRWTRWLNRDGPGGSGDFETLKDFVAAGSVCAQPTAIQCSTVDGTPWNEAGQQYRCDAAVGGVCVNQKQAKGQRCHDYRVRFCCPG